MSNLRKERAELLGRQEMHRWYSGASENSIIGVVCGSKRKMRSSYNLLQGLHCGWISVKYWFKMNSVGSKRCLAPRAACIFLARGHWTSRWWNESRGEISVHSLNTMKEEPWLPPLKHLAFYLLYYSLALVFTCRWRGWMQGVKAKDGD